MHDVVPLGCLAAGTRGHIAEIVGRTECVQRLREMGLRVGARVEIVHGGTPCIVRIDGQRLCFRNGETMGVLVQVGEAACLDAIPATAAPSAVNY